MQKTTTLCVALFMTMGLNAATTQQIEKAQREAFAPTRATAPFHAKAEVIDSPYDQISVTDMYTDVWFQAKSTDGMYQWFIDIELPMSQLEFGKVYTLDDMLWDYSFGVALGGGGYFDYASVECVLSNENDKMTMDCQIVDTKGNEYHVYYKPLDAPVDGEVVEVGEMQQVLLSDMIKDYGAFQFLMTNSDYEIALCFASTQEVAGTYTTDDLYEGFAYTYLKDHGQTVRLHTVEATIMALNDKEYAIEAKLSAYDGTTYLVNTQMMTPTAKNAETLISTDLSVDDSMVNTYMSYYDYGLFTATASSGKHQISAEFITRTGIVPGHYDTSDAEADYVLSRLTVDGISTYSGAVDVERTADGFWTLQGEVLCWNSTVYTLDLSLVIPEVTEERNFISSTIELADLCTSLGVFQVCGTTPDEYDWISFVFDADEVVSGHYDQLSVPYRSSCIIYLGADKYQMYSCDVTLDWDGQEFTLEGTCQAGDIRFNVYLTGEAKSQIDPIKEFDDPDNDLDLVFTTEDIVTYEVEPGDYVYISCGDATQQFATLIYINGDELPAGEYEINATFAPGTVQPGLISDQGVFPTFYAHLNDEGYMITPFWLFAAGTVAVSYDANGDISLDINGNNYWGRSGHVVVNPQTPAVIESVALQAEPSTKLLQDHTFVIRSNGRQYNGYGQAMGD